MTTAAARASDVAPPEHRHAPARRGPSTWDTATEFPRAFAEAALLPWAWPALTLAPRGDGHPVLLLPGFMGSESSLAPLRLFLAGRGYAVQTWGMGRNVGFQRKHASALTRKLEQMRHDSGCSVSLVGWSLGGLFALHAAHHAPGAVRGIVTLGSPVNPGVGRSSAAPAVLAMYRLIAHAQGPNAHLMHPLTRAAIHTPPAVPTSCLYSLSDGVVPVHEARLAQPAPCHENIRVPGSHLGLGFNPLVLWLVAERLAQPEGGWTRFTPSGRFGALWRSLGGSAAEG